MRISESNDRPSHGCNHLAAMSRGCWPQFLLPQMRRPHIACPLIKVTSIATRQDRTRIWFKAAEPSVWRPREQTRIATRLEINSGPLPVENKVFENEIMEMISKHMDLRSYRLGTIKASHHKNDLKEGTWPIRQQTYPTRQKSQEVLCEQLE